MSEEGARTFFICLSRFKEIAPVGQVLLTESVCCSIFGSLRSPQYQQLRFHELPTVDWQRGLNRSDPLQTWRPGFESIGQDICTYRRLGTLDNCLKSGPTRIAQSLCRGTYHFTLFHETFRIPVHIAELWKLERGSVINVQWQITSDFHPHAFALLATKADDGRRVGIRLFTTIQNTSYEYWLTRPSVEAIKLANTLHDFLTGQIVGKDYHWDESRKYIFQDPKHSVRDGDDGIRAETVIKAVRIGLPYQNLDFIWNDPTRAPETLPTKLMLQRNIRRKVNVLLGILSPSINTG